jgi:hypothetical protein
MPVPQLLASVFLVEEEERSQGDATGLEVTQGPGLSHHTPDGTARPLPYLPPLGKRACPQIHAQSLSKDKGKASRLRVGDLSKRFSWEADRVSPAPWPQGPPPRSSEYIALP